MQVMLKPASVLAIFLLLTASFAASEAPQLASTLSAVVWVQGTVTATGGQMHSLQMNVSVPSSTPYQIVEAGELMKFDPYGNGYLSISSSNPTNPFTYSKKITVQSVARTTPILPESYSVPSDYGQFTSASAHTQSADSGMRKLAEGITAGAQTPFEKVALLAIYVNRDMRYDEGMVGQEKDALWVKENLYGVCTEYSTLFTALARSIGIPTRYISGYVYSEKFSSWMGHSWAEAYIGKWVPVDPTWFEVGALDAMHIEESRYAEFTHRDSLSASVSRAGVELDWNTGEKSGATAGNIETVKATYFVPSALFTLESAARDLAPGGTTIAYLSMKGTDYRVIPVSLAGCVGAESILLDESERYLVLEPGKISTIIWQLNASSSLPRNYIYSCPLTLNSPYLEHRILTVGVDPTRQAAPSFEASLHESEAMPGQENSVFIRLPKSLRGKKFVAVLPDGVYSAQPEGLTAELLFSSQETGKVPVYVASESGGVAMLSYLSGSQTGVDIVSFYLPDLLIAGKSAVAQANVSADSYPAEILLDFSFGSYSEQIVGRLTAPSTYSFNFTPTEAGAYAARLSASSSGSTSEENHFAAVSAAPTMAIDKVENIYSNGTLYTKISFLQTGSPSKPTASVAGSTYSASTPLVLVLPLGKHAMLLSWSDAAGNQYLSEEQITVAQPGLLSSAAPSQGCPLAMGLIFVAFAFAAFKR